MAAGHTLRIRTHIGSTPLQLNICDLNYQNINLILYVFHAINICRWIYFQLIALVPNKVYTCILQLKRVGVTIMHERIQKYKCLVLNYILMKQVSITMTF